MEKNVIWSGFRPVGNTEKKLLRGFFRVYGQRKCFNFFKNIVPSELISSKISFLLLLLILLKKFLTQNRLNILDQLCIALILNNN